jgi:hypothetical protein
VGASKYYSIDLAIVYGDGSAPTWHVAPPPTADSHEVGMDVNVPVEEAAPAPTGLRISVKPGPVTLAGGASRAHGEAWQATGTLGEVTVTDDRQDASAPGWTLNGRSSAFADSSAANVIPAANLGWTPVKQSGVGFAGAAVTPGQDGGLGETRALGYGDASASADAKTSLSAQLTLLVPSGVPAGSYHAALTLTLI